VKEYTRWSAAASRKVRANGRQMLAQLDRSDVLRLMQEGLHSLAVDIGRLVAVGLLEDEAEQLCGERYVHNPERTAVRYGGQPGWLELAGHKVPIARPRVRRADGGGEISLAIYRQLQRADKLDASVLRRAVHGVSARNYEQVVEQVRRGFGVKRASISRRFVRVTAALVQRFCERRWDGVRFIAIMIDGTPYAGQMMVVALGITEAGTKHMLGLRQGATENAQVCKELLESLRDRGVVTDVPTLFVLDGAKALHAAVDSVWGRNAIVARCQVHKQRNVKAHLEKLHWPELGRRLSEAYGETDYRRALELLKQTARWLAGINPDAAASMREGMEETLTLVRLGVHAKLRKTLSSTNVIESAFSVAESVTGRVKCWREGDMRWRWCVAGLLHAEQHFRRVDGYRQIPQLLEVLERRTSGSVDVEEKVG
jgi:putative transposase